MRRFSRLILWGGVMVTLGIGVAPAQVNEILRGAANDMSGDIFGCGKGKLPCGLNYRIYSEVAPSEVNSPANPVDGIAAFRKKNRRYITDAVLTANYPQSSGAGFGKKWYIVWDGLLGAGTTDHAGWYGAQSQKVFFSELGNSFSSNCLPITNQEACFAALDESQAFNDTVRADGSVLSHDGGLSPIPCPTLTNGLGSVILNWEEAVNKSERDEAGNPIEGYSLFLVPNPLGAQTDAQVEAAAVEVASVPVGTTELPLSRADLEFNKPGLEGATIYSANLKLNYAGGLQSANFSCNSALSGTCSLSGSEPGDAPFAVDVEQVCVETRVRQSDGQEFLVVTLDMADDNPAKNLIHYELDLGTRNLDIFGFPASSSRNKAGVDVLFRFDTNFALTDFAGLSSVDDVNGRVQFVINADDLQAALGGARTVNLSGRVRLNSIRDTFSVGSISF